jgi:S-adenosylmethionine:tRNA ribosyltransferase-isomerase
VRRTDFAYELPQELIAQAPLKERSGSRLLVLDGGTGKFQDRRLTDFPRLLESGDLLVFNDTRVIAARLMGMKATGGRVEIFLERPLEGCEALVQLKASKPVREELEIATSGGEVRVLAREEDLWRVQLPAPALEFFEQHGDVPLPPYIQRVPGPLDRERYQSIFAQHPGAVAAPTASLHFDNELMRALDARGVQRAFVTLHVGAGTFQPVRVHDLGLHHMHSERLVVGEATCEAVEKTRAAGKRVVAVGTTVARALEAAAIQTAGAPNGGFSPTHAPRDGNAASGKMSLRPYAGETTLFIRPGFRFRAIDALLTNFHLPESTLLMLVCAFAGRDAVLDAYMHAVRERYRFFSYGDAMFVTPAKAPAMGAA